MRRRETGLQGHESDRQFLSLYGQGTLGDSVSVHRTRKGDTEVDWAPGQSLVTL